MLPFIALTLLSFFFDLPFSFGQDYYKHTNCSQPFDCGSLRNISFPFWGHNRAEYCGQPGYELRCEDDQIELAIGTQNYRVLNIETDAQNLNIVPVDTLDDSCPAPSVNVSFPAGHFNYSLPDTVYTTMYYNCPLIRDLGPSSYPCSPYDNSTTNYAWNDRMASWMEYTWLWRCQLVVRVPILLRLADTIVRSPFSPLSLQQVLRGGFEVRYTMDSAFCRSCQETSGHCGYNSTTMRPMCFCYDGEYEGKCPNLRRIRTSTNPNVRLKVAIGISAGVGCLILTALIFSSWKCRHSSSTSEMLVEDFLKSHGSLVHKRYNYYDLKKMTSSFKDKIGQGGFGEVYKGKLPDGRLVAVKLLNDDKGTGGQEFINEVASISRTSHVNIVSLLGFCFDGSKRALIYEFMINGSLEKYIYNPSLEDQPHLGWETLYQIAIGVARGLEYLHRGCNTRILHFDIKPHNILLDIDFTPKISDFGLAKLCPRKESIISMLDARGTAGYIAPEVFSRQFGGVSHKSDVYSYGMMVLEVIGKRKNLDVRANHTSEIYFPAWIYKRLEIGEDLGLNGTISAEEKDTARKMTLVALWCIQTNPMDRPAMTRVVEMLEGTHESLSIPPKPYLCSPPRSPQSLASFFKL